MSLCTQCYTLYPLMNQPKPGQSSSKLCEDALRVQSHSIKQKNNNNYMVVYSSIPLEKEKWNEMALQMK